MTQQRPQLIPAAGYALLSPCYDAAIHLFMPERAFRQALLTQAQLREGQHALDVGCGTASFLAHASATYPECDFTGLDGDPKILERARTKIGNTGANVVFEEGMSYALPFDENHFDIVFSTLMFHHLTKSDKRRSLEEIHRVLRPGGAFHIADWGEARSLPMRTAYLAIQLLDGFETTADNVRGLLPSMMTAAGFESVAEQKRFNTVFGTLSLYSGRKATKGPS
ncbi:MAG: class I SAM-dependent methyltransferase [Candidatus Hydrogenedentes bacterium]|nr:class I SAM-dependent methyltransferase [Candidatus Hydrogenedentota bacterium]